MAGETFLCHFLPGFVVASHQICMTDVCLTLRQVSSGVVACLNRFGAVPKDGEDNDGESSDQAADPSSSVVHKDSCGVG